MAERKNNGEENPENQNLYQPGLNSGEVQHRPVGQEWEDAQERRKGSLANPPDGRRKGKPKLLNKPDPEQGHA